MKPDNQYGIYGFRFNEVPHQPLCGLYATGHETIRHSSYHWNGLTRTDGPLFLFQYTMQGEGVYEKGDSSFRVHSGRAFLAEIPGNHRYYHPGNSVPWEFYFVLIRPAMIAPLWEEIVSTIGPAPCLDPGSPPIQVLKDLCNAAHYGRITDPYIASSYVYQFIMELRRASSSSVQDQKQWPAMVQEAARFLDTHFSRMVGQEQLAAQLGVSKFHFLRTFTKYTGVTPNEYVNRKRIEKSIELLRATDWSIEKIAAEIGYSTGSYYIKVFQKLTGRTPGTFRAANNNLHFNKLFFD
ncbi:AraC family transcriptional regulator [Paenibacillus thermotolerans]|uniref:AraC family transcriptional regulator n=1 Tax=Paenibacillus thermotolerans TaxID=3027807 RepID=UPI0023683ED8|nr:MULTISPECIES: AraC family transcriptional regulator [unclassified Paenibacillus]